MRGHAAWIVVAFACSSSSPDSVEPPPDARPVATVCGDGVCTPAELATCGADCGAPPGARCGDGTCNGGETTTTCSVDCTQTSCGDGTCAGLETFATCPADCAGGGSAICGNGLCESGETSATCGADCASTNTCPGDPVECFNCWFDPSTCVPPQTEQVCEQCLGLGSGSGSGSGPCDIDLVCDAGEDPTNCPTDCP